MEIQTKPDEIDSERWLYIALMTTLTIGYMHLLIFFALLIILVIQIVSYCCLSREEANARVGHLTPVKLWQFIEDGIFSLLDDLDSADSVDDFYSPERENREAAIRRLALDKLNEKPFETVRLDTIDQIKEGFVQGNLNSFKSPSHPSLSSSKQHISPKNGPQTFVFAPQMQYQ